MKKAGHKDYMTLLNVLNIAPMADCLGMTSTPKVLELQHKYGKASVK